MTQRRKGSLFTLWVLVLTGIFISFGTAHSQSFCDFTFEEINQALLDGQLGAGTEAVLFQRTAEEWLDFVESDFGQCICSVLDLDLVESQDFQAIDQQQLLSDIQACTPDVPPISEPTFTLTVDPATIDEGSGNVTVTVNADRRTDVTREITLSFAGTATRGMDYNIAQPTVTLVEGQDSVSTTITIVDDRLIESSETIVVTGIIPRGELGTETVDPATITILDDDEPEFSLTVDAVNIVEDGGSAEVTVSTGGATFLTDQTIALSPAGTATEGTDYAILEATLVLPARQTSVSTAVTAIDDTVVEGDETIEITARHADEMVGAGQTITILDDDEPEFSLTVDAVNIVEDGGSATVTVSTGEATFRTAQTITLVTGGTATEGEDYTIAQQTLTLSAGETSVSTTVTATDDTTQEGNETLVIEAQHAGEIVGGSQTITIIDNDMAQFTLTVDATSIDEDGGSAEVTVSTGEATFRTAQTITLVTDGTATQGTDYAIAQQTLTLSAGQTSVSTTVTATDDTVQEGDETLVIEAQHDGEAIGAAQTITITDNDMAQFTLTVDATSINEDGGSATVTVRADGGTFEDDQTITLAIAGTATEGEDYTIAQQTLTLSAGETSVSTTVTATDDTTQEGNETLVIEAQHAGEIVGGSQTITIIDNDMAQFTLTVDATSIDEDGGSAEVTVSTGEATFRTAQTITLVTDGTATQGTDYAIAQQTLTLSAGQTSVSTTVTATDDTVQEGDETLVIEAQHAGEIVGGSQTITITDNDMAQFTLTVDATSINEDGGSATVTVRADGGTFEDDQTITLAIAGTATQGTDYAIAEQTLTLPAGETSVSTTVTATDDTVQEGSEETITITAQLAGVAIGVSQTITITEAEPAPPPTREVVEETLEAVVTSTISNVTTNIGTRFSAARSGTAVTVAGRRIPFAESVLALSAVGGLSESALFERDDGERQGRDLTLNKLLETSSFQVALAANGEGTQAAQPLQSLTVWGRVDRMFFDKESNDANRYDGDLSAGYLGLDTWLDDRWLIGVAASVTKVKAGYGLDTGGKLDLSILGVHPYLRLAVDGLSEVWVILGLSAGKIQNWSPGESKREKSDITMTMGAAGLRRQLATIAGIDIALLGDAGYGSLRSGGRSGLEVVDNLSVDSWRARLGFSGSHTIQLEGLATLTPFVEVVGRYDGGGDENSGVEIAGGIQYANPVTGLGFEIRANVLPLYSDSDYREYGFSLSASASPGIGGEGLAMTVATSLGPESGSAEEILRRKLFGPVNVADNLAEALSLNAEVGYGFPIARSRAVLTPFGGFRLMDSGGKEMRAGMRLGRMAAVVPWNLELAGEQRESDYRDTEYLLSLLGRVRF